MDHDIVYKRPRYPLCANFAAFGCFSGEPEYDVKKIDLPRDVKVTVDAGNVIRIKSPKEERTLKFGSNTKVTAENGQLIFVTPVDKGKSLQTNEFEEYMRCVNSGINNTDTQVVLMDTCDLFCSGCINNKDKKCRSCVRARALDKRVAAEMKVSQGEVYLWSQLKWMARENIIFADRLGEVCRDCPWVENCLSYADLFSKIRYEFTQLAKYKDYISMFENARETLERDGNDLSDAAVERRDSAERVTKLFDGAIDAAVCEMNLRGKDQDALREHVYGKLVYGFHGGWYEEPDQLMDVCVERAVEIVAERVMGRR